MRTRNSEKKLILELNFFMPWCKQTSYAIIYRRKLTILKRNMNYLRVHQGTYKYKITEYKITDKYTHYQKLINYLTN